VQFEAVVSIHGECPKEHSPFSVTSQSSLSLSLRTEKLLCAIFACEVRHLTAPRPAEFRKLLPFRFGELKAVYFFAQLQLYTLVRAFGSRLCEPDAQLLKRFLMQSLARRRALSRSLLDDLIAVKRARFFPIKAAVLLLSKQRGIRFFRDIDVVVERRDVERAITALNYLGFVAGDRDEQAPNRFIQYTLGDTSRWRRFDRDNPSYEIHFTAHHHWRDSNFEHLWARVAERFDVLTERQFYVMTGGDLITRTFIDLTFPETLSAYNAPGSTVLRYLTHMAEDLHWDLKLKGKISPNAVVHCSSLIAKSGLHRRPQVMKLFAPLFRFTSTGDLRLTPGARRCLDTFILEKVNQVERFRG
jgi:hypothetical protein